jgi:hypothetical protein
VGRVKYSNPLEAVDVGLGKLRQLLEVVDAVVVLVEPLGDPIAV